MENDHKRKATPDINEELMMNLMVDGVKKEGIQLPPVPTEVPEKEVAKEGAKQKESPRNKAVQREKSRARKNLSER